MKNTVRRMKVSLATALAVAVVGFSAQAAPTLQLAVQSSLTGLAFEDRPLLLPVERNFQMAMLTASSELGRSCGKMEAFAWQLKPSEQDRVNDIFRSTIDRLRVMGYTVAPGGLKAASKDITLFTADVSNKHFMFLWSASDAGLVLNICETSSTIAPTHRPTSIPESVQVFPVPAEEMPPLQKGTSGKFDMIPSGKFSPVGEWTGTYACVPQGQTGATLKINSLKAGHFEGVFKFYPTQKNPTMPEGAYTVHGQFDKETNLILINPGKWIKEPKGFYNTVMVGRFDPAKHALGVYFEGVTGCTSFEARRDPGLYSGSSVAEPKKHAIKKKKKAKKPAVAKAALPADAMMQGTFDDKKDVGGIHLAPAADAVSLPPSGLPPLSPDAVSAPGTSAPVAPPPVGETISTSAPTPPPVPLDPMKP